MPVSQSVNEYNIGDAPRIWGRFRTVPAGVAIDPSTIRMLYTKPDGTDVILVYGVDAAVIKSDIGQYYVVLPLDTAGRWKYRWEGTGAAVAGGEFAFFVLRSGFYP